MTQTRFSTAEEGARMRGLSLAGRPFAPPPAANAFAPAERIPGPGSGGRRARTAGGFSLVELLVAMTLLSLIVLVLMAVFSGTQQAFRASVTQTGVLEGGRAAMAMMAEDLQSMTPVYSGSNNAVNFCALDNNNSVPALNYPLMVPYQPLVQGLPGGSDSRTNVLNYFFFISRNNMEWTGVGYVVNTVTNVPLYPLYRFYAQTNINASPMSLYAQFVSMVSNGQWTNLSHLVDGVVHLTVRPYDLQGYWMTNNVFYVRYYGPGNANNLVNYHDNMWFSPFTAWGETGFCCYSNAVPSAVELELGILEDRTLQRAESLGVPGMAPWAVYAESNYLAGQAGHLQLFRQRVNIPNVDPTAYQ